MSWLLMNEVRPPHQGARELAFRLIAKKEMAIAERNVALQFAREMEMLFRMELSLYLNR